MKIKEMKAKARLRVTGWNRWDTTLLGRFVQGQREATQRPCKVWREEKEMG